MELSVLVFFRSTAQKMKFSIKESKLRIWPHLLKKSLMENYIFCAVHVAEAFFIKPIINHT